MEAKEVALQYQWGDFLLKVLNEEMVNLTDLWREAGMPKDKAPADWLRMAETADFVTVCILNMVPDHVLAKRPPAVRESAEILRWAESVLKAAETLSLLKRTQGRSGGTFAHRQIALAYAEYLSPEFNDIVDNIFRESLQETAEPELGLRRSMERAVNSWKAMGHDNDWIVRRLKGIDQRNEFNATLGAHGVRETDFETCSDAIYQPILQGTEAEIKERTNLPAKANLRDMLSELELLSIEFAEALAECNIKQKGAFGKEACAKEANRAGEAVMVALMMTKAEPARRAIH